jgi:hypothetical protein
MTTENAPPPAVSELDRIIRDPQSRYQFHKDPHATLRNAGADPDDVPTAVWQVLTALTPAELDAVAALGVALADAGLLPNGFIF